jgi:outer membrane lipoprotein-sorting protein
MTRALAAALAVATVACGAPLMKLPSGAGAPAADAAAAFAEATAACRAVTALTADVAASGSVNGERLRGHLLVGLAAPASARLEAVAPAGQPIFIFVAHDHDATLLLPRDDRVVEHDSPAAVLEAVAGVPVDAAELRHVITGCASANGPSAGTALNAEWRRVTIGSADAYLHRDSNTRKWQLVAAVYNAGAAAAAPAWRAEYRDFESGLPRSVHLVSADRSRFDLRLVLSQVALNESLGAEVFRVDVPRSAERITLDEFRHARTSVREN